MKKAIADSITAGLILATMAVPTLAQESTALTESTTPDTMSRADMNNMEATTRRLEKARLVEPDAQTATRVYGGRPAWQGEYPAQIGLHMSAKISSDTKSLHASHFCGGSIIARQWILTAAHCVTDGKGVANTPQSMVVRTGSTRIDDGDLREIEKVIVHEAGVRPISTTI